MRKNNTQHDFGWSREEDTERSAESYKAGPIGNLSAVLTGIIQSSGGAFVPAWSQIVIAVERTGGVNDPFVAVTDQGGAIFAEPGSQSAEDAFGIPLPWPTKDQWPQPVEILAPAPEEETEIATADPAAPGWEEFARTYTLELLAAGIGLLWIFRR